MRTPTASLAAIALLAFAASACATGDRLTTTSEARLAEPIATIAVEVDPEIIETRSGLLSARRSGDVSYVGPRDAEELAADLKEAIEEAFAAQGLALAPQGAALTARITRATPNNPEFTQVGQRMNLRAGSFARGGATIEAEITDSAGAPAGSYRYSYFDRTAQVIPTAGVWTDANRAFDRFARSLVDELRSVETPES